MHSVEAKDEADQTGCAVCSESFLGIHSKSHFSLIVKQILSLSVSLIQLQNIYAPDPDPEMIVEHYERTKEQNDDLGITDMKTENYEKS